MSTARWTSFAVASLLVCTSACARRTDADGRRQAVTIRVEGSDTMVNIAQAWAEEYHRQRPDVSVQVLGGGSGVGIASLMDGNCDLANCSREMSAKELQSLLARRGEKAAKTVVGYDGLALYVNPRNPIPSISLAELAEIYGEGGETRAWSQLGVELPPGCNDRIVWVNRQNSSGTYAYFAEAVLGKKRDYKLGSIDQSGSKDVIVLIAHTPGAIGYSGMGYSTSEVRTLGVAWEPGGKPWPPTAENVKKKDEKKKVGYPIARPLLIYTAGKPAGPVKEYLDWILSPQGQQIVKDQGYVRYDE